MIPGYDEWKTTPPDDTDPDTDSNMCGGPIYEGDALFTIDGGICEDCLNDYYKELA